MTLPFTAEDINKGIIADFHNGIYNCGAFDVYLVLYCQQRIQLNTVKISLKEIGKRTGFSEWKVMQILNSLIEQGIIERKHGQGERGKYVFL